MKDRGWLIWIGIVLFFWIIVFLLITVLKEASFAESYLYLSQKKNVNAGYTYCLPKLELNQEKYTGLFFNMPCYYLSEFEGSLVYTAPRNSMFALNHSSINAGWNLGVEISQWWVTYSIEGIYHIEGNNEGVPEGFELANTFRGGIKF